MNLQPNDKVAIITDRTRTEWHILDIALLQIGVQSVPIYDSTSLAEMTYIFNHAAIKYCFVSNKELYDKVSVVRENTKSLIDIYSFDDLNDCKSIYSIIENGKKINLHTKLEKIKNSISSDDIATIIYTSGTTAMPKGAMISHDNLVSALKDSSQTIPSDLNVKRALSLLPVSHIFERMMHYMYQYNSTTIYFAESLDTVADDMQFVQPHMLSVVPRLLEKIYEKIYAKGTSLKGFKKKVFHWSLEVGSQYKPDKENGATYERNLKIARKLVFKKWQEVFGGKIKLIITGGSKLQLNLSKLFNAANLYVAEGYGLTESSAIVSVNSLKKHQTKLGSVGKTTPSNHVVIAKDGEVLIKGANIMKGYYNDAIKTEKAFVNGYFKTGDIGHFDKDGFLFITGRKKDIFKTSGGKYIAPIKIEDLLKKSNLIELAIVIGEHEKFPATIIQPNFEKIKKIFPDLSNLEISKSPKVLELIQVEIDTVNKTLGQWEKIKKFALTPDEWTTTSGHLTPTMKIKRDVIKAKYYILFNQIYR